MLLCEYIVVAEFDILSGSTIRCCLPNSIGGFSDDELAELLLPPGGHNVDDDEVYFTIPDAATKSPMFGVAVIQTLRSDSLSRGARMLSLAAVGRIAAVQYLAVSSSKLNVAVI